MATTFRLKRKLFVAPLIPILARGAAAVGRGVVTAGKAANAAGTAVQAGGVVKDGAKGLLGTPNID